MTATLDFRPAQPKTKSETLAHYQEQLKAAITPARDRLICLVNEYWNDHPRGPAIYDGNVDEYAAKMGIELYERKDMIGYRQWLAACEASENAVVKREVEITF